MPSSFAPTWVICTTLGSTFAATEPTVAVLVPVLSDVVRAGAAATVVSWLFMLWSMSAPPAPPTTAASTAAPAAIAATPDRPRWRGGVGRSATATGADWTGMGPVGVSDPGKLGVPPFGVMTSASPPLVRGA
jgi:hypothetical protein